MINIQGLQPYHTNPNRLSSWEEAKVNQQIQVFVKLGKMRASLSEHACKITLPMKKDSNSAFMVIISH
jgi:hypothetical protein